MKFYGISEVSPGVELISFKKEIGQNRVHLEFVGASDTAGYCVDGTPETSLIDGFLNGWKYGNCDYGLPGRATQLLKTNNTENIQYSYRWLLSI